MIDEAEATSAATARMRREQRDFRRDRPDAAERKRPAPPRFPAGAADGAAAGVESVFNPAEHRLYPSAFKGWPWIALAAVVLGLLNWRRRRMDKKDKA